MDILALEDEPSPLEYARVQGLCVDYTTEPNPFLDSDIPPIAAFDEDICSLSTSSITDATFALLKERLAVSREAALLLKTVHTLQEAPVIDHLQTGRRKWLLDLKQELPVLQSDHDVDLLSFGSVAPPDFKNTKIPSELVIEQNDEGFEWPTTYLAYPARCNAHVKAEKLAVSRNVLLYLQETIRYEYMPEDDEMSTAASAIYKPDLVIQPITPPLLPLSPLPVPYIPSSPANNLPLVSDSCNSVCVEAQELQCQIMAADSLTRKESDSSDSMLLDVIHPPPFSPLSESCTLVPSKRKTKELKVEGPLTPPILSTSPMKKLKSVSFAAPLDECISHEPWGQDRADGDEDIISEDFEFFAYIEPLAQQVRKCVKNERLSGVDTTARVDVPDVDFTLPVAPWIEYSQTASDKYRHNNTELEAQMQFLRRTIREDLKSVASWHGMSVPERELQWSFLMTKVSTLKLDETLHGETEAKRLLSEARIGNIATSSAQVWKQDGLRVLDEDEEDEIESVIDEGSQDMKALLRKRRLEMEEETEEKNHKRRVSQYPQLASLQAKTGNITHQMPQERNLRPQSAHVTTERGVELMFGGFSATSALHRFLETRGKAAGSTRPNTIEKPVLGESTRLTDVSSGQTSTRPTEYPRNGMNMTHCRHDEEANMTKPLPSPADILVDLKPCSFIISSKFLLKRSLLKQIEQFFPKAEMVYRDYTLPHSPAKDADLILSPSTGMILTSSQQIKQRALPGQTERSPIKEYMATLQSRYERLIILVSEGLSRELEELGSGRPDDPRDREAFIELEAFAAQMEGDAIVQYVPGGEKALARSTVMIMGKYGLPYGSADIGDIKPIPQETTYEVFLRRAGLNPFAAQAIVALLKKPVMLEIPPCSSSPFSARPANIAVTGLSRFLLMSKEERIYSFQALMGGSRVLRGISDRLDQEWISAAHGFRI